MLYTYKYKSGESFSYKCWNVKVEERFGGIYEVSFTVDVTQILRAIDPALQKARSFNDTKIQSFLHSATNEIVSLQHKPVDSFTTKMFSSYEKSRLEAQSYIDNKLGDGFSYVKKNNLLPSIIVFF